MKEEEPFSTNAYKLIADRCGLSEKTIRTAFSRKPITYLTACRIVKHTPGLEIAAFRIKEDRRGRKPPAR